MSEKPKKSLFGNLFGGNNTGNTEVAEARPTTVEEAPKETEAVEHVESADHTKEIEKAKAVQSAGEDYQTELVNYQNHQTEYQAEKAKYDKVLNEYETVKNSFDVLLKNFNPLAQTIKDARGLYDVDFEDYIRNKVSYGKAKNAYIFARSEQVDLTQQHLKIRENLGRKKIELDTIVQNATSVAQDYEKRVTLAHDNEQTVNKTSSVLSAHQNELSALTGKYTDLTEKYEAQEPSYSEAKNTYEFANQLRNDYDTLKKQSQKMQTQEDSANVNLTQIKTVLEKNQENLEVNDDINAFSSKALESIDSEFAKKKTQFMELEMRFTGLKERYNQESGNFIRIQKNYKDLNSATNINRVALHYVTEEFNSAKAALENVETTYKPVAKNYKKQKEIFDAISKIYAAIKTMDNEVAHGRSIARQEFENTKHTHNKVEESYNYVKTQNEILKQNLATKEGQFFEVRDNFDEIVARFATVRQTFEPLSKEYLEVKGEYDRISDDVKKADEAREEAQKALETSQTELAEITQKLAVSKSDLETAQKEYNETGMTVNTIGQRLQETTLLAETTLLTAKERYALTSDKYRAISKRYDEFSVVYSGYMEAYNHVALEYERVSSLYRLGKEEYSTVHATYHEFMAHGDRVNKLYTEVMTKYSEDKDYYDRVYGAYEKVQASREDVVAKKKVFDVVAQNLKTLLVSNNNLTFPIYEATGQNFVDSFNLPKIAQIATNLQRLKNKQQLSAWEANFRIIRDELANSATLLSNSLVNYQQNYNIYREVGGKRLAAIDTNSEGFSGIDLMRYIALLDQQVDEWRKEYTTREKAFVPLIDTYDTYLEREKQLVNLVSTNSSAQDGVQAVINLINAIPDYADMYSSAYGDLNLLAQRLSLPVTELTRPKSEKELMQLLRANYYDRALSIIQTNVAVFENNLNNLRTDYENSLDNLHKALGHFTVSTGISTSQIHITGVLNDSINLEQYLETGLKNNFEKLQASVSNISSVVNVIKRSGTLSKVANRTIDTTADSTLVFPDKPISMSRDLLETEVTIYELKMLPIPVQPDKPTEVAAAPVAPSQLAGKVSLIEKAAVPGKVDPVE